MAREQVHRALCELSDPKRKRSDAIHQARKRCKMIRGLLRLVRPAIGKLFSEENAAFRDAARHLSEIRDSDAIIESFDRFCQHSRHSQADEFLATQRDKIIALYRNTSEAFVEEEVQIKVFINAMRSALGRMREWSRSRRDRSAIERGFSSTHEACRRAMSASRRHPCNDNYLHELRKRVKDHWYQCKILLRVGGKSFQRRAKALGRLSSLLGDDRDLVGLRAALAGGINQPNQSDDLAELISALDEYRRQMRSAAFELAEELFSTNNRQFMGWFHKRWKSWRNDA